MNADMLLLIMMLWQGLLLDRAYRVSARLMELVTNGIPDMVEARVHRVLQLQAQRDDDAPDVMVYRLDTDDEE